MNDRSISGRHVVNGVFNNCWYSSHGGRWRLLYSLANYAEPWKTLSWSDIRKVHATSQEPSWAVGSAVTPKYQSTPICWPLAAPSDDSEDIVEAEANVGTVPNVSHALPEAESDGLPGAESHALPEAVPAGESHALPEA